MKKPLLILILLLIAVFLWMWTVNRPSSPSMEETAGEGEAAIGGEFSLTDQHGNPVKSENFHGQIMLVFFGFTRCPDICPVTVSTLSNTMNSLSEEEAKQVAPIFITVDPEHDTPAVLKEYLANFNPRIIGLTGSLQQVQDAANAYKAYFAKVEPQEEELHQDRDEPYQASHEGHEGHGEDEAMVDHSGFVYLMDRNGKYVRHFSYNVSQQELTEAIKEGLK